MAFEYDSSQLKNLRAYIEYTANLPNAISTLERVARDPVIQHYLSVRYLTAVALPHMRTTSDSTHAGH